MVVVPLSQPMGDSNAKALASAAETRQWLQLAAGGAIVAGGLMLLTGWRRAGLVTAASGTALAMLDQQQTLRSWWKVLPGYIGDLQQALGQVQGTVEDISAQRENLRQILGK